MSKTMQCRSLVFHAGIKSGSIAKKKIKIQNPKKRLKSFLCNDCFIHSSYDTPKIILLIIISAATVIAKRGCRCFTTFFFNFPLYSYQNIATLETGCNKKLQKLQTFNYLKNP